MRLYKYHGLGNDFIILEDFPCKLIDQYRKLAIKLCNRRLGVGADGLVLINKIVDNNEHVFHLRNFNADGTESKICGNAVLCTAKHLFDHDYINDSSFSVLTKSGKKFVNLHVREGQVRTITVNMGLPYWYPEQIPVISEKNIILVEPFIVNQRQFILSCVSMGNPHAVCILEDDEYEQLELEYWGPLLEKHERFPEYTNVEFINIIAPNAIKMKVWERGVGITPACGTGACASAVVAHKLGIAAEQIKVLFTNGTLQIRIKADGILMTGTANRVFVGMLKLGRN